MNARDTGGDLEILSRFAAELDGGGTFEPVRRDPEATLQRLPGRVPGEALATDPAEAMPPGPRAIILDCGTSRLPNYTHVLWIAPIAESVLGSSGFERLGEIVGRVFGVTGYEWEGIDRLHVAAGDIAWAELLAESREALGVYMAGRK